MADLYITVDANNLYQRPYLNQADADAAAADAALTAVQGIVTVPSGAVPRQWVYVGGLLTPTEPELLAGLDLLKYRMQQLHSYLLALAAELTAEGVAHPVHEVHAAHNFPAWAHHGAYRVAHHAAMTNAQKITWAEEMAKGPTNAATAHEWYVAVAALNPVVGPSGPCSWIDESGARVEVSSIDDVTPLVLGANPMPVTETQLANGNWIEGLT